MNTMPSKGVVDIISDKTPAFCSKLFLVGKASGVWRLVIDLSPPNSYVQLTKFKMVTVTLGPASIEKGDFMFSLDLKDAYFQIPIHPELRLDLQFSLNRIII